MTTTMLSQFARLTEFLGRILGPDYEIALHDLSDPDCSLIAIANSHVSGRAIGAPLTEAAKKFLLDDSFSISDYRLNYTGYSASGKTLRSSTLLLRSQGKPIGMLCVNFDDRKFKAVSESILRLCHPDAFVDSNFQFDEVRVLEKQAVEDAERFPPSAPLSVADAIARHMSESDEDPQALSASRRRLLISRLDQEGHFRLKGAVPDAAQALGVSPATVYRMLSQVRQEQ